MSNLTTSDTRHAPSNGTHSIGSDNNTTPPSRRRPTFRAVLAVLAILWSMQLAGLFATMVWSQSPPEITAETPDESTNDIVVVRITASTPADVQLVIAQGLDLLEMRDGDDLFALVARGDIAALQALGLAVRVDAEQTALLAQASLQTFFEGYSTVEETEQFLQTMAATYPDLTTLHDFGDSWVKLQSDGTAGYDLWALHITNKNRTEEKPVFFLLATIHAREIVVSEIATRFIAHLLENYGSDPDITWLVDEHDIVVVPMLNPDGHKLAEEGLFHRKNLNDSHGSNCANPSTTFNQIGVDLNRNFAYAWGTVNSPDTSPCSAVYPGPSAASEPETQAVQALIAELFPDRPRPADGLPVPPDTSGVLISMHSYSDIVLWPWGNTLEPAPDAEALERLGQQLAAFPRYQASQSIELYPTSGTTDDWSYGELGIASYTFEIGPSRGACGGFMPPYRCLDEGDLGGFWARNLPALLYAARVSSAPYSIPAGPLLNMDGVQIVTDTSTLTLTLTLTETTTPISNTVLYVGATPQNNGLAVSMAPVTSTVPLTNTSQRWRAVLPLDTIYTACDSDPVGTCLVAQEEVPLLLLRGQDAAGNWGRSRPVWAHSTVAPPPPREPTNNTTLRWLPRVLR
ncbi:MAG: hypothetical protein HC828_19050 [Blastochloris sp.]|nr:hypothetical protein [Blastochloris sp.]